MKYEVYEVPNELDGTEEFLKWFNGKTEAVAFAKERRELAGGCVWVILASDEEGYIRVVST